MALRLTDASVIEIYGRDGCPFCVKAKNYVEEQEIPFTYHIIEPEDGCTMEDVKEHMINTGMEVEETPRTIPQIFGTVDGKSYYIGGFKELISIAL